MSGWNPHRRSGVYRGAMQHRRWMPMLFGAVLLTSACTRPGAEHIPPPVVSEGDQAGPPLISPDRRCVAYQIHSRDGHSPLTTSRVGMNASGTWKELRLPAPNERFSTFSDGWEAPGVLALHATTLDGDIKARYHCATGAVEVLP